MARARLKGAQEADDSSDEKMDVPTTSTDTPRSNNSEDISDATSDESHEHTLFKQCKLLAKGVYGLPEAIASIHSLKTKMAALTEDRAGLMERMRTMTCTVEDLSHANQLLRQQAGVSATHTVDLSGIKLAKDSMISELRAVNNCLEREVGELEEERRRLKAHLKFNAKYQGQIAVDLGLSPDQLSAIDQFVDQLKSSQQAPQHDQDMSPQLADSAAAAASHTSPTSSEPTATNDAGQPESAAPVATSTLPAAHEPDATGHQPSAGMLIAVSQDKTQDTLNISPAADKQLKDDNVIRTGSLDRQLSGITTGLTQPGDVVAATTCVVHHASLPPASQHAELHSQAEHAELESGSQGGGTPLAVATDLPNEQGSRGCKQEHALAHQHRQELGQQSRFLQQQTDDLRAQLADNSLELQRLQADKAQLSALLRAQKNTKGAEGRHTGTSALSDLQDELLMMHQQGADMTKELHRLQVELHRAEGDKQGYIIRCEELDRGLAALTKGMPQQALERQYADVVSRMAGMQLHSSSLTHQLGATTASEKLLQAEKGSMSKAAADMSRRLASRVKAVQEHADILQAELLQVCEGLHHTIPLKVYESLSQQLRSLSDRHQALVQHQAASLTQDSEVPRLRSELSKSQSEVTVVAGQLAAAQQTCRVLEKQVQGSKGQPSSNALDPDLVRDLVDGQVSLAAALRRADMAEQRAGRAERAQHDAHDMVGQVEARVALLTRDLHQAREDHHGLQQHFQGGACYEEVCELWQRVKNAEQTASEALAELHTHKDAAVHATFELKEAKKESAARHAEAAAVRTALREAQTNSPSCQPLSHLQADMAQLRWQTAQCLQARAACEEALAGQIPAYKLDMLLRQLTDMRHHNDTLAQQLKVMSQRLLAAEQAKDESDIKLQHTQKSPEGATDTQTDGVLQLRLDNAKLMRSEAALRAKGSSLEEALKALEARLSEYEAQAMAQHAALEHGKHQDLELTELRVNSQAAAAQTASKPSGPQSDRDEDQKGLKAMQATTRNVLLAQVEQLRESRLECEALKEQLTESKHQAGHQQHALHQLRQQHQQLLEQVCEQRQRAVAEPAIRMQQHEGAALEQVQALAQSTIQDLHNKLAAKTGEVEECHRRLQAARSMAAGEVTGLQDRIEQLSHQLQLQDQRHVKALVAGNMAPAEVPDQVSRPGHAHLRHLLTQLAQEKDHCQARLDQLQAQYDWKVDQLQQHASGQQQECSHLKAQLQAAQKALAAAAKDAKLSQLRRNMHALEAKLIHAMQSDAHRAAAKDTGQEQLQKALQENAQLQITTQKLQAEVRELQLQAMLASPSSSQDSTPAAGKEHPARQTDSTPCAKCGNADSGAAAAVGTVGSASAEDAAELGSLRAEVAHLQTERGVLAAKLGEAQQQLAEARRAIEQKEGHLQGLQRLLEEEERSGRSLQQQLRQQLANVSATAPANGATAAEQGQEAAQHQVAQLQQQLAALEYKLQQAESSQGTVKQPLQAQQLPENLSGKALQNPVMAKAVADASHRPNWQNPMAVHLSEAEKAEVQSMAEAAGNQHVADENGVPQSLLAGHPGLLQWEEKKKMQKRIDQLRAKLKEKSGLVEQLQKEKQKKGEQVQQAHADLARQAALIKDLQAHPRGKKELKEGPASLDQVRDLVSKMNSLEEQRDALERQVAARQPPAAGDQVAPPGSGTASDLPLQDQLLFKESELVEARLERSQAQAKAQRAQQRLDDFLAQQPAPQVGSQMGGEGSKQGLIDTIQGLQRALERSRKECEAAVSSAKYMQLLEKKKELSKKCSVLEEEARIAAGIKEEAHRLEQRCQQMQAANAALKKQLKPLQEGHFQAKALAEQVEGLQAAVDSKDAELVTLRKTLQHKEAQVEQLKVAEGAIDEEIAQEIATLRDRLALIETENADMREELSAFDPAFFDEIEDLKYDHHQLQLQCTEYESIVRELSAQLGIDAAVLAKAAG
ncbi:MAG: hypothetical protein FRX49_09331 [Trebouxia sp. A1-2]|nr:MAG: hypothetical protein FRX49_09331 [Trebouxia sp. A1-2]